MKRCVIAATWVIVSACGPPLPHVDPAFTGIVDQWVRTYAKEVVADIRFLPLELPTVGQCEPSGIISIDPTYWAKAGELAREQLLYHELGHCRLFLGHDSVMVNQDGNRIPRSIMYPYVFGGTSAYRSYREYYHAELAHSTANEVGTTAACR